MKLSAVEHRNGRSSKNPQIVVERRETSHQHGRRSSYHASHHRRAAPNHATHREETLHEQQLMNSSEDEQDSDDVLDEFYGRGTSYADPLRQYYGRIRPSRPQELPERPEIIVERIDHQTPVSEAPPRPHFVHIHHANSDDYLQEPRSGLWNKGL
jgi:hypothetical protein